VRNRRTELLGSAARRVPADAPHSKAGELRGHREVHWRRGGQHHRGKESRQDSLRPSVQHHRGGLQRASIPRRLQQPEEAKESQRAKKAQVRTDETRKKVLLPENVVDRGFPAPVVRDELVYWRSSEGFVFSAQELECDPIPPQFPVHARPLGKRPAVTGFRRRRRQNPLESGVVEFLTGGLPDPRRAEMRGELHPIGVSFG
jgi:hypothetical protein